MSHAYRHSSQRQRGRRSVCTSARGARVQFRAAPPPPSRRMVGIGEMRRLRTWSTLTPSPAPEASGAAQFTSATISEPRAPSDLASVEVGSGTRRSVPRQSGNSLTAPSRISPTLEWPAWPQPWRHGPCVLAATWRAVARAPRDRPDFEGRSSPPRARSHLHHPAIPPARPRLADRQLEQVERPRCGAPRDAGRTAR